MSIKSAPGLERVMLKIIPFFSELSGPQLESIGAHAALQVFEKGDVILRQGEQADSFFVIVSGQVKVFMTDKQAPDREVILRTLGAGDFFGEIPMFDHEPRSASVSALERCHVQVLSYRSFQKAIERSPDIANRVMATLTKRLRDANRRIGALALMDISSRVSRTLLELAILSNGRRVIGEPFTQKDLANMIGASREMVNRTLQDLQDEGYIEVHRKSITILNDNLPIHYPSRMAQA
jgi:CRP/FNR family cyclic AMP-dependent transcriptional regulator